MTTMTSSPDSARRDNGFDDYLVRMRDRVQRIDAPMFHTQQHGIFDRYLALLPTPDKQYHHCTACRLFFERYADLAIVGPDGGLQSVVWDHCEAPAYYRDAVRALEADVVGGKITGVFLSAQDALGTPVTTSGERWTHYAMTLNKNLLHKSLVLSPDQAMAAKREDYEAVLRALRVWDAEQLEKAVTLLRTGALDRSEKVLGGAEWLLDLRKRAWSVKDRRRENLVWAAVATAPDGFCHPRSSMLGSLMDDISAGKSGEAIKASFATKMHGLAYQRPKAEPKAGAIDQAEKLVETLGLQRSLERRYARLEEVTALWKPRQKPAQEEGSGVFSHLRKSGPKAAPLTTQHGAITWAKFARDVLPHAAEIECQVPARGAFFGLVTAVHADAPPLLRWDYDDARNPVSWYFYSGGSAAGTWQLRAGGLVRVNAICISPAHWGRRTGNDEERAMLILEGARDTFDAGLALFPENLRSELHGVRSVLESYSRRGAPLGRDSGTANGLAAVGAKLVVTLGSGDKQHYTIDRME